jgi:hypothetical protein
MSEVFPDILRTRVHCQIAATLAGNKQYNLLLKGNSPYYVGPGVTRDGFPTALPSFVQNYYSNLQYLVIDPVPSGGSSGQLGARAPYSKIRFLNSTCKAHVLSANSTNAYGATCVLLPTINPLGWTTLNQTTLGEQDLAVSKQVPANTTANGVTLQNSVNTMKMFGLRYPAQMEDQQYATSIITDPASIWYWMLDIQSFANDTSVAYEVIIDLFAEVEVFGKNIQGSAGYQPA